MKNANQDKKKLIKMKFIFFMRPNEYNENLRRTRVDLEQADTIILTVVRVVQVKIFNLVAYKQLNRLSLMHEFTF